MIRSGKKWNAFLSVWLVAMLWALMGVSTITRAEDDLTATAQVDDFVEVADNPRPDYPAVSLLRHESGTVILSVIVHPDGTAKQVEIKKSSGYRRLDEAAQEAVRQWRFRAIHPSLPAAESRATVPITFTPVDASAETALSAASTAGPVRRLAANWTVDQNGCQLFDYNVRLDARYVWSGACKHQHIEGPGVVKVMQDGRMIARIEGEYHLGQLEGHARMQTVGLTEYQGPFLHGLKHGHGVQTWKHGRHYEGDFIENVRTGHGVLTYPGDVRYEGEFLKGAPVEKVMHPVQFSFKRQWHFSEEIVSLPKQGSVLVQLWITAQGSLQEVEVLESDHPAYEKEVLRSLASATMTPATLQGKPIPVLFTYRFKFGRNDMLFKPHELALDADSEQASVKPDKLTQMKVPAPLVYPLALFQQGKIGKVTATVTIDPQGQVREIDLLPSSEPAFAEATRAMLLASTFTPATREQQPVWSKMKLQRSFDRSSGDVFFDRHILRLLAKIRDHAADIFKLADLDRKPRVLFHPLPVVPSDYVLKQDETVMLSFYIDKTGRVQLPQVLSTHHPALGWLAMTAVSRWQFEPPTIQGEPVDVTVNLPILFAAPAVNAAAP